MTTFDEARALREQISGLQEVAKAVHNRMRLLENQYAMLEQEVNIMKKLVGFVDAQIEDKMQRLHEVTQ